MALLKQIQSSDDVKKLNEEELPLLAAEIRERLLSTISETGGHIGPNLGVVELTIGLHRIFNTPKDRFVFDVAHLFLWWLICLCCGSFVSAVAPLFLLLLL